MIKVKTTFRVQIRLKGKRRVVCFFDEVFSKLSKATSGVSQVWTCEYPSGCPRSITKKRAFKCSPRSNLLLRSFKVCPMSVQFQLQSQESHLFQEEENGVGGDGQEESIEKGWQCKWIVLKKAESQAPFWTKDIRHYCSGICKKTTHNC